MGGCFYATPFYYCLPGDLVRSAGISGDNNRNERLRKVGNGIVNLAMGLVWVGQGKDKDTSVIFFSRAIGRVWRGV